MNKEAGLIYYVRGRTDGPKIALTFDDGPNPPRTEEILEILAAKGARATFFVIGKWAERWPRTLERIVAGGHVVGIKAIRMPGIFATMTWRKLPYATS